MRATRKKGPPAVEDRDYTTLELAPDVGEGARRATDTCAWPIADDEPHCLLRGTIAPCLGKAIDCVSIDEATL